MVHKVSPTRLALLQLKKEVKVARRGHKLLKDKRDGLVKRFMAMIREARVLRADVERRLGDAMGIFARANAMIPASVMENALLLPGATVRVDVRTVAVMSVEIPQFTVTKEGSAHAYGFVDTTGDLDRAVAAFDDVLVDLVRLAQMEKALERMAQEIERTRRRVSALEHVRIPALEQTIRFITLQLEERNRDAVVATMRVKAMIEAKEAAARAAA